MKKLSSLFMALPLVAILMFGSLTFAGTGDIVVEGKPITGKIEIGGGTLELPNSDTLPGTCVVGDTYVLTSTFSGQQCYVCESTDVWVSQGSFYGAAYFSDYNEVDQGATGDGESTKAYVDIISTDSATLVFRHNSGAATTTYTFSTDETIPANINVIIEKGAILSIANTKTLTINTFENPGLNQVFSGDGEIFFGPGSVPYITPQMFGAIVDGTTDDLVAINKAITCSTNSKNITYFSPGIYNISAGITITDKGVNIKGEQFKSVILNSSTDVALTVDNSDNLTVIEGMVFWGSTESSGGGILIQNSNYGTIKQCAANVGGLGGPGIHLRDSTDFVVEHCQVGRNVAIRIRDVYPDLPYRTNAATVGFQISSGGAGWSSNDRFIQCTAEVCKSHGFAILDTPRVSMAVFENILSQGNVEYGMYLSDGGLAGVMPGIKVDTLGMEANGNGLYLKGIYGGVFSNINAGDADIEVVDVHYSTYDSINCENFTDGSKYSTLSNIVYNYTGGGGVFTKTWGNVYTNIYNLTIGNIDYYFMPQMFKFYNDILAFGTGDATPTVSFGNLYKTTGTTAITDFDDGAIGQMIIILAQDTITITDNASIILSGGVNYDMTNSDTLTLLMMNNNVWQEITRSVN